MKKRSTPSISSISNQGKIRISSNLNADATQDDHHTTSLRPDSEQAGNAIIDYEGSK